MKSLSKRLYIEFFDVGVRGYSQGIGLVVCGKIYGIELGSFLSAGRTNEILCFRGLLAAFAKHLIKETRNKSEGVLCSTPENFFTATSYICWMSGGPMGALIDRRSTWDLCCLNGWERPWQEAWRKLRNWIIARWKVVGGMKSLQKCQNIGKTSILESDR